MVSSTAGAVHIVGRRSYLAGVLHESLRNDFEVRRVGAHELRGTDIASKDVVVNCGFPSEWRTKAIPQGLGPDGEVAEAAKESGATFVMLSSRAVYPLRAAPPLAETELLGPVSLYGKNKLAIEEGLQKMLGERLLILRPGNVFGAEPAGRENFVSTALGSIKATGTITLNMLPSTRKDFVPHSYFGAAVRRLLLNKMTGVFNIGTGIALPVGELADALIRGFGRGKLSIAGTETGEEFCLDTTKLYAATGVSITKNILIQEVEKMGRDILQ